MRFTHKPTGKPLYLIYNRLFDRLPTIAQKPDNVIQFSNDDRFYIFDAKYRIQFDPEYVKAYGGPGPTTEDVNTMHRYRDAIAIPHPMKPTLFKQGIVSGSLVLFPYPNETAYLEHRFYKSIAQVEIGGLPFLPRATSLVSQKLSELLDSDYPNSLNAAKTP
jgi:PD-(D/E)XK nuclease superfamily